MSKSRVNPPTVLPDDATSVRVLFYFSEGDPRVTFSFPTENKSFDHALSEYSSLNGTQKTTLRTMLIALRDETFTLEGYA